MNRREFFKIGGGILAGGTAGILSYFNRDVYSSIISHLGTVYTAKDAVKAFQYVSAGEIMYLYPRFFPSYLSADLSAPDELDRETKIRLANDKTDSHRLEAMPALAAVHLLPQYSGAGPNITDPLWHRIISTLDKNPKREVKEIIFQNLVASLSTASHDYMFIPEIISDVGFKMVHQAKDSPLLLFPLSCYIQYLLSVRQIARSGDSKTVKIIDKAIDEWFPKSKKEALPSHFEYVEQLIGTYRRLPKPDSIHPAPLLPQLTEALMGYQKFDRMFREILQTFALIMARTIYSCYLINHDTEIMTGKEALRSRQKLVAIMRYHDVIPLLYESIDHIPEIGFRNFLNNDLPDLLKENLPEDIQRTAENATLLSSLVPFSRFSPENLPFEVYRSVEDKLPSYQTWLKSVLEVIGGSVVGITFVDFLYNLLSSNKEQREVKEQIDKEVPKIIEKAREFGEELDQAKGSQMDELEEMLGPLNMQKAGALD